MLSLPRRASSILAIAFLAAGYGLAADTPAVSLPAGSPPAPATTPAAPAGSPTATAPTGPAPWVIGLARLAAEDSEHPEDPSYSPLQENLPLLIISDLPSLPARRTPDDVVAGIAALTAIRSRFSAGADLASKLDARALSFFDPVLDVDAWKDGISTADKQVSTAKDKLKEVAAAAGPVPSPSPAPADTVVKLWDGHAKGQLLDIAASGLSQAAKTAKVDLLVSGTVSIQSGYAIVELRGYDAALDRQVFAWKGYCAIDDPGPLAADFAGRLERWAAGRDFARLTLSLDPASAELSVNGEERDDASRVIYAYSDQRLHLYASAAGYSPRSVDIDLALGDEKSLELKLDPLTTGKADLSTNPEGAAISLDSVPLGMAPVSIPLDGSRRIVMAQEKGRESQTIILPPSGETDLTINLLPTDGLGPKGRILAAKDGFYSSFGWFVLSIPVTALSWGVYNGYSEAYNRSFGDPALYGPTTTAEDVFIAAAVATGVTLTFVIFRLVKYLASAH